MQTKVLLLATLAACSSVASAGYARVFNKCTFPSYLWVSTPAGTTSSAVTLPAKTGFYQEQYQNFPQGGGVAIKLTTSSTANPFDGSALTQDQYTLSGSTVWYSLSDSNGDPYRGFKVQLVPDQGTSIVWATGTGPSQILNTASTNNLTLTVCA